MRKSTSRPSPERTREHEYQARRGAQESLSSQLCKLHIKVLCKGQLPIGYLKAYDKVQSNKKERCTLDELRKADLMQSYLETYGYPNIEKPWLTVYQRNLLLAFAEFIDDPLRCHKGRLAKLQHCKSVLSGLQFKQRVNLFKVVTTLVSAMSIETGFIGQYADKYKNEFPVLDENGFELFQGIQHHALRSRHYYLWGHQISKTMYFDCLRMLKSVGFFEVTACYVSNTDAPVIKHEMRERGASVEELEEIPRVYSVASYKLMTDAFFSIFKEVLATEFMQESKALAIAKRIKRKLSLVYATFDHFGNVFVTKRNKFLSRYRYPQGANPSLEDYGALVH